jgi:ABC-type uncharacterized transport system ATPase subunit
MHAVSDGERRRVQLVMGLMAPWDVLLLDEVTVDLDVLVRKELLSFLQEECETRGATVLCRSRSAIVRVTVIESNLRCNAHLRRT